MLVQSMFIILCLIQFGSISYSVPVLTTFRNDIIDARTRQKVKLMCVAWPAHMEPMIAEGLANQPLVTIVSKVVQQKFNCVRLSWATYMFTRYNQSIVGQTLDSLNLTQAKEGIAKKNPDFLGRNHIEAFTAVIDELGKQGLMVILDNHVSKPQWCCGDNDGNGFFGDRYFDPDEWKLGLSIVAQLYKSKDQVIGMSLRNELRGPRQNPNDWYKYISEGISTIRSIKPGLLTFVSGLSYATDLTFLKTRPLQPFWYLNLVFEFHWYSWTIHGTCQQIRDVVYDRSGFVTTGTVPPPFPLQNNSTPLLLGEFGINQAVRTPRDDAYIGCLIPYIGVTGWSWSLWGLQGSYYSRQGILGLDETFGVLDKDWSGIRNPNFMASLDPMRRRPR